MMPLPCPDLTGFQVRQLTPDRKLLLAEKARGDSDQEGHITALKTRQPLDAASASTPKEARGTLRKADSARPRGPPGAYEKAVGQLVWIYRLYRVLSEMKRHNFIRLAGGGSR